MRLLLDENFPRTAVEALRQDGHDVIWIRTHAPGMKDKDVIHLASQDERIVLTLNKDFHQLSLQRGKSRMGNYGVILFRVHPAIPEEVARIVRKTLSLELNWLGHMGIVSEASVQMFPLRVH